MRRTLATSIVVLSVFAAATPQPPGQRTGAAILITKLSGLVTTNKSVAFDALHSRMAVHVKIPRDREHYEQNTGMKYPFAMEWVAKRTNDVPSTNAEIWCGTMSVGGPAGAFTSIPDTGVG